MSVIVPASRREFLGTLLAAPALSFGQTIGEPRETVKLAENFIELVGGGTNILLMTSPEGCLLVDGGDSPGLILKTVAELGNGRPVRVLFNTHWHAESTGSNEVLKKAGARIIAHENTKLWLGAEFHVAWEKRDYQPRPPEALPDQTFYTTGNLAFGGQRIEYGYLPQAHTDSDIYVYFPGPNILMAGGVVTVGRYPILDYSTGGWIGGLVDAQRTLLKVANGETRIVPSIGPVLTRADLQAQSEMFNTIRTRLVDLLRKGAGPKEMVAAKPTRDFDDKWGDPELFILNAYQGLWGHVRELGGIV